MQGHPPTFIYVLIGVKNRHLIVVVEAGEGVHQMRTQVGVDVLRDEFGHAFAVHRPVCVVADDALASWGRVRYCEIS